MEHPDGLLTVLLNFNSANPELQNYRGIKCPSRVEDTWAVTLHCERCPALPPVELMGSPNRLRFISPVVKTIKRW